MIPPYQSKILRPLLITDLAEKEEILNRTKKLPAVIADSSSVASAVMLGAGYFTPLDGFMSKADAFGIAEKMISSNGLFWPIPILLRTDKIPNFNEGGEICLLDSQIDGNPPLAIQLVKQIDELNEEECLYLAEQIFGTADDNHPGVKTFLNQGRFVISGDIKTLNFSYFEQQFPNTFQTAYQIREEIMRRGWQSVISFQTRNPMHRAHEELCKIALAATNSDGLVIHMLLGQLKSGDIPAKVRDQAIRKMVDVYFPANTVHISGYGFDMLYAGPREAVLHAIFRQNMGASYMIVGRDHAGVGDYYGAFDAQAIFRDKIPAQTLDIQIYEADHTAWSKKLNKVVMMRDVQDHGPSDYILLSGTRVREMLTAGEYLPPEFTRPEVAKILMTYYQSNIAN